MSIRVSNSLRAISGLATLALLVSGTGTKTVVAQKRAEGTTGVMKFKMPDGYVPAPMADFFGGFVLDPNKPMGMFVAFPNDNETAEVFRQRLLRRLAEMFIHDGKGTADMVPTLDTKSMPSHPEDGDGKAFANFYVGVTQEVQVVMYERPTGPLTFFYGYFAMRHNSGKGKNGKFLDEQGQGVKAFDKFWKSFPKMSKSSPNKRSSD